MLKSILLLLLGVFALANAGGYDQPCCFPSGECKLVSYQYCHYGGGQSPVQILSEGVEPEHYSYQYCSDEIASLCPGACCYSDRCEWTSEAECNGLYQGNGTSCDYDCAGACCSDSTCTRTLNVDCSGSFHGIGTHCRPEGECPRTNWILGMGFLFAVLFFLGAIVLLCFVACRNRRS